MTDKNKWSAELQHRLIADGKDQEADIRNLMAEAACCLAALSKNDGEQAEQMASSYLWLVECAKKTGITVHFRGETMIVGHGYPEAPAGEPVAEDSNLKTWPKRIWLQHHEAEVPNFNEAYFGSEGITWCQDCIDGIDIEYVRADLCAAPVDRDAIIEECAKCATDTYCGTTERGDAALIIAERIRHLKSAPTVSQDDKRDAERGRFLVENWHSTIGGTRVPAWITENAMRLGGVSAAIDQAIREGK